MRLYVHASEHPIHKLSDLMGQMMDQMANRDFYQFSSSGGWAPALNLYETDSGYLLCLDLAGMSAEDIDVTITGTKLVIRGNRPNPRTEQMADAVSVHVMEIPSGIFRRTIQLPADAKDADLEAHYKNGFLWLIVPRAPRTRTTPSDR